MNCWVILGLRADADEREIKRSYAALLKVHRPDEELEAFQRLRGAYEQALAIARRRAEEQDEGDELDFADSAGDTSQVAELELPAVAQKIAAEQEQMLASLVDLAPPTLDALAVQAKFAGRLALFERCLLERCLNDSEQGYDAAQWALVRLSWLTPWQEASLSSRQLDALANRLLSTELHGLRALLAEGDEQTFLTRVSALHEQAWLQPFDLRAYFNRQLVDILLAVAQWAPPFFKELCARCGWDELQARQAGWLREWDQLSRRGELAELEQRIRERLDQRRPDSGQARAAWLMLKPLSNGQRKSLVDGFGEKDWEACELLEQTLRENAPEVLQRMAPEGLYDWRRWLPGLDWQGVAFSLWLLLLVPSWLLFSNQVSKAPMGSMIETALSVAWMTIIVVGALLMLHRGWRLLVHWLTCADVLVSQLLLPAGWVRGGTGLLLLRHVLPSAALTAAAVAMGATQGMVEAVVCGATAPLALLYADFTTKIGSPVRVLLRFLRRYWRKLLWLIGLSLFALACYWGPRVYEWRGATGGSVPTVRVVPPAERRHKSSPFQLGASLIDDCDPKVSTDGCHLPGESK